MVREFGCDCGVCMCIRECHGRVGKAGLGMRSGGLYVCYVCTCSLEIIYKLLNRLIGRSSLRSLESKTSRINNHFFLKLSATLFLVAMN